MTYSRRADVAFLGTGIILCFLCMGWLVSTDLRMGPARASDQIDPVMASDQVFINGRTLSENKDHLEEEIRKNPNSAFLHHQLGMAYGSLGEEAKEFEELVLAQQLDPENPYYHYAIGTHYAYRGLYSEAIISMQNALHLDDQNPYGHWQIGEIFAVLGMHPIAISHYERARDLLKMHGDWYTDFREVPYSIAMVRKSVDRRLEYFRKKATESAEPFR